MQQVTNVKKYNKDSAYPMLADQEKNTQAKVRAAAGSRAHQLSTVLCRKQADHP